MNNCAALVQRSLLFFVENGDPGLFNLLKNMQVIYYLQK